MVSKVLYYKENNISTIAVPIWFCHFEYTVIQFGTINTPANFLGYRDDTILNALNHFGTVYMDEFVTYSNVNREHVKCSKYTFESLLKAKLYPKTEL